MRFKQVFENDSDAAKRLLTAAEDLFAERGVDKTSLRDIAARSGMNVAAVNYHFGSKEALAEAVFEAVSLRVNQQRMASLDACLAALGDGERPAVETVIRLFIAPYFDRSAPLQGLLLARFILQHRLTPSAMSDRIIARDFDPMARRYIAALMQACPSLTTTEAHWGYMFIVSAVVLSITDTGASARITRLSDGLADISSNDEGQEALIAFLCRGISR